MEENKSKSTPEAMFIHTEKWASELAFYRDELRFLYHLVDKYFVWLLKEEQIDNAQALVTKIHERDKECIALKEETDKHLIELTREIDHPSKEGEEVVRKTHEELEEDLSDFVKDFKETKRRVFETSEKLMATEKLGHLLNN